MTSQLSPHPRPSQVRESRLGTAGFTRAATQRRDAAAVCDVRPKPLIERAQRSAAHDGAWDAQLASSGNAQKRPANAADGPSTRDSFNEGLIWGAAGAVIGMTLVLIRVLASGV